MDKALERAPGRAGDVTHDAVIRRETEALIRKKLKPKYAAPLLEKLARGEITDDAAREIVENF